MPLKAKALIQSIFGMAIFLAAFLSFSLQPMVAKILLPKMGGAASVWTATMLFFQGVLLAGYLLAHLISNLRSLRLMALVFGLLIIAASGALYFTDWSAESLLISNNPVLAALSRLALMIGIPYLLLATISPLLQFWWSKLFPDRSAYSLYSLSNAGSLLGLASYPFLLERYLGLSTQRTLWLSLFILLVVLLAVCVFNLHQTLEVNLPTKSASKGVKPGTIFDQLLWVFLSFAPVVLFLGVTHLLCDDVAAVPLLWVAPLAVYLITLILAFSSIRFYKRGIFIVLLLVGILLRFKVTLTQESFSLSSLILVYLAVVFVGCAVAHAELVKLKPDPSKLTYFYLLSSLGGALGGVFVLIIAPKIFHVYAESSLALQVIVFLLLAIFLREDGWVLFGAKRPLFILTALLCLAVLAARETLRFATGDNEIEAARSFYGVVRVIQNPEHSLISLFHGQTEHGSQYQDPAKVDIPTTYYGKETAFAKVIRSLPQQRALNIGAIGLGVGTIAAYGRAGDNFKFYEINPDIIRLAQERFSFLKHSKAKIQFVEGDARISLSHEAPQQFDLLFVDAFSGGSIPLHLINIEAVELYLTHLAPGGLVDFHISNNHMDLTPVLLAIASKLNITAVWIDNAESGDSHPSVNVVLAKEKADLSPELGKPATFPSHIDMRPYLWSDEFGSVISVLR